MPQDLVSEVIRALPPKVPLAVPGLLLHLVERQSNHSVSQFSEDANFEDGGPQHASSCILMPLLSQHESEPGKS